MTMPAYTRAVAEVLAAHQSRPTGSPFCRCGWRPSMFLNDTESDRLQHIGHQADMLAASNLLADPADEAQVLAEERADRARTEMAAYSAIRSHPSVTTDQWAVLGAALDAAQAPSVERQEGER